MGKNKVIENVYDIREIKPLFKTKNPNQMGLYMGISFETGDHYLVLAKFEFSQIFDFISIGNDYESTVNFERWYHRKKVMDETGSYGKRSIKDGLKLLWAEYEAR